MKPLFIWIRGRPATMTLSIMGVVVIVLPIAIWHVEQGAHGANIVTIGDGWWYGVVTMLTVGYGDRFAVTPLGRILATALMFVGVIGMSIVTARISSIFLEKALRDRRGLVDANSLKQHFIVCGWKSEMNQLLTNILRGAGLKAEQIVLVNNVSDSAIETLQELPELKKIKWIKGDFFQVEVLRRAAPDKAQKVLILADATPGADGSKPTISEADARTVMTAMTLSNIAKGTPVAAEILDAQMDQYLKLAHVHEVIYSRDYSRLLLAMASTGTGVTNILQDLLNPQAPHLLTTEEIPGELAHKTFGELRESMRKSAPDDFVLGLLENAGNGHIAKEVALKKAQQTPDISKLVSNLNSVKTLRFNQPVFSPAENYVIREGSRAIVIRPRRADVAALS